MTIKHTRTEINKEDKPLPVLLLIALTIYGCGLMAVLIFPIAKDWGWFEAWAFIITFMGNTIVSYLLINKENPRVLRNRMKVKKEGLSALTRKSAGSDKFILPVMGMGFFGAMIIPALDHRFDWTSIPLGVEMAGLAVLNAGLIIMEIAMLQNAFASKLLDINKGQKLIDTGLYARVRHPLYSGSILMILALPLALGSLWGVLPAIIATASLLVRINFEEEMLVKGMDGYREYQERVKFKLVPGIF